LFNTTLGSTRARHAVLRTPMIITEKVSSVISALSDDELRCLDRTLEAISVDPGIGAVVPGSALYDLRDGPIRVIYHMTARGTVIVAWAGCLSGETDRVA
jgi:hypothetical protein